MKQIYINSFANQTPNGKLTIKMICMLCSSGCTVAYLSSNKKKFISGINQIEGFVLSIGALWSHAASSIILKVRMSEGNSLFKETWNKQNGTTPLHN